ncbi:MAG TPA: NAD-dependent dehydratase [Cytophagales bacterium]|nr:NAD-dependent dehydratase [Cytophagales bacterium]
MRYLVTGGSGFIGSALVKALLRNGHSVKILDNNSRGNLRRLSDVIGNFEFIEGDIRDKDAVVNASRNVDSVCHLAYINGTEFFYSKPELILEVGVKGMMNVVDACLANGIPELILASSSEVYQHAPRIPTDESVPLSVPDPLNPRYSYGGGKIISELIALNFGRRHFDKVIIFRPHNVYGPDMGWEHVIPQFALRMREQISKGKIENLLSFPIQGTGDETRSFVYIDDFSDGLMLLLNKGVHNQIYHIGTEEEVTIKHVAQEVGDYFGINLEIIPGTLAEGGTLRRCPDIGKMKQLGFMPKVKLKEGIHKTVEWYATNAQLKPIIN